MSNDIDDATVAEHSVLGGCILRPDCIDDLDLRADEFHRATHQAVWRALVEMRNTGDGIDVVTLAQHMQADGEMFVFIGRLAKDTPGSANVAQYAKVVRECAKLRRARSILAEAQVGLQSWRDVQSAMDSAINKLSTLDHSEGALRPLRDFLPALVESLDDRFNSPKTPGIATGNADLDNLTGGMRPGDLWVVAARPSMGKTVYGLNASRINAIEHGLTTAFFSLEMTGQQLTERYLSAVSNVYGTAIRDGRLSDEDWPKITNGMAKLRDSKVWIDETPALSIQDISRRARRLASKNLGLIVVDYLQLVTADARSREQEVAEISRGLKSLAKQLRVPIIALCQLNRELEKRKDKRPMMSDLRESGQIEQDADVIIGLYRDEVYNPTTMDKGVVEFIVLKQRNGPTDTIRAQANLAFSRFDYLDYASAPPVSAKPVATERSMKDFYGR